MSRYVIRGGKEGKERLKLLSQVMLPSTSALLKMVGLNKNMQCLDIGCGGGDVTLLMANIVGSQGKVIGVDFDPEILALAQQDAQSAQLDNVEFRLSDALEYQEETTYDLVYARFLLTHLHQPEQCVNAMIRASKPKGAIAIEDIDFTGSFCYPDCPAYEKYVELYQQVVHRKGGDPNIAPRLPIMLHKAGLKEVQINIVQPTHLEGEGKLIASITMEKISSAVVAEGLATASEIEGIIEDLNNFATKPDTVMSLPRVIQTWGIQA